MNEWIDWFQRVLDVSIRLYFRQECDLSSVYDIPLPKAGPLWKALLPEQVDPTFDEWMVLMLALMPHLSPQVLDIFFVHNKNFDRPYTEFGGWKGLSHGGFLPTGETAVFLLAGDRVERRLEVVRLFREEHWFHMYHVVGLEGAGNGEPFLSGQLRISEDFLYRLSFEGEYKPDYNMGFPAKRISTALNWEDAVLPYYVREELEEINNWITGHRVILSDWGLSRFLKAGYRTLFYGPPGLGKTTLASIIANEMGVNLRVTSGPAIEKPGDLAALLTNLSEGDVLFIDEIHRLSRIVEEVLYPAMEDNALDIIIGKGPSARSIRLDLPRFTLVGATTRAGQLTAPLRDRFGVILRLELYTPEQLGKIVNRSAGILNIEVDTQGAREIASRSRGTPRIANRLLKRARDFAQVIGNGVIDAENARAALDRMEIDSLGLDSIDRLLLTAMIRNYNGGPVGLETIAAAIGEEAVTIEDVYEPYLMQIGFLSRTPRGRIVTPAGYRHLGIDMPGQQKLDL